MFFSHLERQQESLTSCGQSTKGLKMGKTAAFPSSSGPLSLASAFSACFPFILSIPPSLLLFSSCSHHHAFIHLLPSSPPGPSSPGPSSLPTSSSPSFPSSQPPVPKMLHRASLVLRLAGGAKEALAPERLSLRWVARQWTHKETSPARWPYSQLEAQCGSWVVHLQGGNKVEGRWCQHGDEGRPPHSPTKRKHAPPSSSEGPPPPNLSLHHLTVDLIA